MTKLAEPAVIPEVVNPPMNRPPPLENGDHLDGAEFMRRYEAMPGVKAELIEGIVHLAGHVRSDVHGQPVAMLSAWLGQYAAKHPGLIFSTDSTVILADDDRVQPDLYLMRPLEQGGTATIEADGYVHGPPELVVEVAASTASIDSHEKATAYHRAGVREYLLWRTLERRIDWYARHDDLYYPLPTNADDHPQSPTFPGLRLPRQALLTGNLRAALDAAG